jgi:hypothetical protein
VQGESKKYLDRQMAIGLIILIGDRIGMDIGIVMGPGVCHAAKTINMRAAECAEKYGDDKGRF